MFTISVKPTTSTSPGQSYEVRAASGKVLGTLTRTEQGYVASDDDLDPNPAITLTDLGEISLVDADPNDYLDITVPFGPARVKVSSSSALENLVKILDGEIL